MRTTLSFPSVFYILSIEKSPGQGTVCQVRTALKLTRPGCSARNDGAPENQESGYRGRDCLTGSGLATNAPRAAIASRVSAARSRAVRGPGLAVARR